MLLAILAIVALVSGIATATVVFFDSRGTEGLRTELSTRTGADLAYRANLDLAADAQAQDAEVRTAIERTFAPTGVDFAVTRAIESEAYLLVVDEFGTERSSPVLAATIPELDSRAVFEAGGAPTGPGEVAVQADAAAAFGLEPGDECFINEVAFTVSGTWRPVDPLDPRWYGDPLVADGGDARRGPFAITEDAWPRIDQSPLATWTIVPASIDEFTASNFSLVTSAWGDVRAQWRGQIADLESLEVQVRLTRTLDEFGQRIAGLRAIEPVAFAIMVGSALVALAQLVQLLVATRERESALFWARGQSPAGISRRITAEVGLSAIAGAVLGIVVVAVIVVGIGAAERLLDVWTSALLVPGIVVVGVAVIAAVVAFRSATGIASPAKGGRGSGRVQKVAVPGIVALAVIAAALSVWQLRLYGSPLTPDADGGTSVDPIAVAAPAATLLAVVLIGRAVFPLIVRLLDRRSGGARVSAHLASRTLVRESRRLVAPLVVVAIAVGAAVTAAAFSATWTVAFDRTAQLHAGADLRASSRFAPITSAQFDAVAATDGVDSVAPLDSQVLSVGTITGTTLSATPEAIRTLATTADGMFDPAEVADTIATVHPGPVVADGTASLDLRIELLGFESAPTIAAWVADPLGRLHRIEFGDPTPEADGIVRYTSDVEGVSGTLVSFDLDALASDPDAVEVPRFRLVGLEAHADGQRTDLDLEQFWIPDSFFSQRYPPYPLSDGSGFEMDPALPSLRLTAALDGTATDIVRPAVVVSQRLADELDLAEGDLIVFSLRNDVEQFNASVAGIAPAIPGSRTDSAVLMDLTVTLHVQLRVDELPGETTDLWVATDEQTQVRDAIRPLLAANTRIDVASDPVGRQVLGAAAISLWAVALGCALVAVIAVSSAATARTRWGRGDIAALRALGVGARDQSAMLVREMLVVLAVAVATGLVAGAAVAMLTVPELARAAVDRSFLGGVTVLEIQWLALAALLAALAAGVAAVLAGLARRTRILASTLLPDEERE